MLDGAPGLMVLEAGPAGIERLEMTVGSQVPPYPPFRRAEPSAGLKLHLDVARRALTLTAELEKGGTAFALAEGHLTALPGAGLVVVLDGRVFRSFAPWTDVAGRLSIAPGAVPVPVAPDIAMVIAAVSRDLAEAERQLNAGILLSSERGQCFLRLGEHTLSLRDWQTEDPQTLVASPFYTRVRPSEWIWTLLDARPLRPIPLPDPLAAVLPKLRAALAITCEQAIDHLVAGLRAGRAIHGGPTTDQRWKLHCLRGRFVMTGKDPEGVSHDDVLTEAQVREMFATYPMFGLGD